MFSHLGRYEIIEELGRGAMGVVYKARDPLIDRFVALKTIDLKILGRTERGEFEARFYQEARAAGRLNHPNVVTIHDVGESGDVAYIAMEFLDGRELKSILADGQRLPVDDILEVGIQVAVGLAYANQNGVVHRDIKPSNIMVLSDGRVKIVDFGIARMDSSLVCTLNGMGVMGSPSYMSPEQVMNHPTDCRSDIFSLGIVLHQMLTGKLPFVSDNINSVMFQIVNEEAPRPSSLKADVPDMLDIIVARCLAKEPGGRFQTAAELAAELRACRAKLLQAQANLDRLRSLVASGSKSVHQLIYVSRPTQEITMAELRDILTKSQFKNLRLDLSGLLVFHNGRFMQLLEGRKQEVADLFAKIRQDPRHTEVEVVLETDSAIRCMPSWAMGFSAGDRGGEEIRSQDFYISPEATLHICESMGGEVGRKFLQFIHG